MLALPLPVTVDVSASLSRTSCPLLCHRSFPSFPPLCSYFFLSLSFLCHWLKSEHKLCSTEGTALCSATGKRGIPLGFQSRMCLSFFFFFKQSCINREVLFLKSLCASGEKNVFIVLNFVRIDEGNSTITD